MQSKYKNNLRIYITWFPFIGLLISLALLIYFLLNNATMSFMGVLYILIPLLVKTLIYLPLKIILDLDYPFLKGKMKFITIGLVVIIVFLFSFFNWSNSRDSIETISLSDAKHIDSKFSQDKSSNDYYMIYGSDSCIYCTKMEPIYESVRKHNKDKIFYYVDLTNESINDSFIKEKEIKAIPVLVHYKKGREVNRLEGLHKEEDVIKFIND